jgi:hypothetical protein
VRGCLQRCTVKRSVLRTEGPKTVCCNIHSLKACRSRRTASVLYTLPLFSVSAFGRSPGIQTNSFAKRFVATLDSASEPRRWALIIYRFCVGCLSWGSRHDQKRRIYAKKTYQAAITIPPPWIGVPLPGEDNTTWAQTLARAYNQSRWWELSGIASRRNYNEILSGVINPCRGTPIPGGIVQ